MSSQENFNFHCLSRALEWYYLFVQMISHDLIPLFFDLVTCPKDLMTQFLNVFSFTLSF